MTFRITLLAISLFCVSCTSQNKTESLVLKESSSSSNKELKYIGMPVGGITTGQVYLGGDGQLWYWDIFNIQKLNPGGPGDKFYLNPLVQNNRFEQGFAVKVYPQNPVGITSTAKTLRQGGFSNITFTGEYPIGKVNYSDPDFPVSVKLNAYTPFIPTNHESSDFPAVVLEYTLTNDSDKPLKADIIGWLQNMAGFQTAEKTTGTHNNQVNETAKSTQLVLTSEGNDKDLPDYGNMTLTLMGKENNWANPKAPADILYNIHEIKGNKNTKVETTLGKVLTGTVGREVLLQPGESKTATFIISWYFPNIHREEKNSGLHHLKNHDKLRHYYSGKFSSSTDVANTIIKNADELLETTKQWNTTWYNSTLPKWFLDRTFLNVSTLATTASYRFDDLTDDPDNEGRFYAMEGVYLGEGTCTHVFHYEQALGRVFPSLARKLRTQVDFGLSYKDNGIIGYRGEVSGFGRQEAQKGSGYAVDGHAGTIMRAYREHTTAPDNSYLKNYWPKIKKSIEYMIAHDAEKTGTPDGILEGIQYNTLDREWYGKIAWISGMYNAALRAGEAMAKDIDDKGFAKKCATIAQKGNKNISEELFNGEYFYQILDQDNLHAPNSNDGCHADQLLGQYWVKQVGLPDIVLAEKAKTALSSIVKYNYFDRYKDHLDNADIPVARYYATAEEPALIVCSFPKGGADKAPGKIVNDWEKLVVGYFSEPWTGQEHQVAATLIDHGLWDEAMKIESAVHARYAPEKRNPYNEVEYGNHYTRAMSGYAPFISASGFTLHEPNGKIGFAPKINPDNFKSAFITGNSWGTFTQNVEKGKQVATLELAYGTLKLREITLDDVSEGKKVQVQINEKILKAKLKRKDSKIQISFKEVSLKKGDKLELTMKL